MTFPSFNFWKAIETLGEEMLDLNFPNKVSGASVVSDFCSFSSPEDALPPSFQSAPCALVVPAGPENSASAELVKAECCCFSSQKDALPASFTSALCVVLVPAAPADSFPIPNVSLT